MTTGRWSRMVSFVIPIALGATLFAGTPVCAQGLGGAGTVQGTVKDPTGGVMVAVSVTISNSVTGFTRTTTTDNAGKFVIRNLAPNNYHVEVTAQGFNPLARDVDVRSGLPIELDLSLGLAGATTTVEVTGHTEELAERDPTAHVDLDQNVMDKLPVEASSGLNSLIALASPGVASDANGFFHPMGDHAQTQFSIDNQPVTDQQSRIYSNQLPPDAVQSLEIMQGIAPAEYGDKTSLIVQVVTKSGLGAAPAGSATFSYGNFNTPSVDFTYGFGNGNVGNFAAFTGMSTDRFLDTPESQFLHDTGDQQSIFDRLDVRTGSASTFHLDFRLGRSSFDIPNTLDANGLSQPPGATGPANQHQNITSYNVAPGYSQVLSSNLLLTANAYVRGDHVTFSPSANPFNDLTASVSQDRRLTNIGGKVDLSYTQSVHSVKFGGQVSVTPLTEKFTLGVTDPAANSPCVLSDGSGLPDTSTALTSPAQCAAAGDLISTNSTNVSGVGFLPGLAPYDLTRGGSFLNFNGSTTVKEESAYVQDSMKFSRATINLGLRADHYDGLATASQLEPRVGVTYQVGGTGTVLRSSYGRFLETPYNENLILSSATGAGGLANILGASQQALTPGTRNAVDVGAQQGLGKWVLVDVGYYWKYTTGAFDFDNILGTPIAFPIEWQKSQLHGLIAHVNLVEHKGFSAFVVMGTNSARYFYPEVGGLLQTLASTEPTLPNGQLQNVFRIDHDQAFQQTTNLQYRTWPSHGAWGMFTWKYDSGLISGVRTVNQALGFDADGQVAMGLACNGVPATLASPFTSCNGTVTATRVNPLIADAVYNPDTNPSRIAPRNVFNLGFGLDNVLATSRTKLRLRFSVTNLLNNDSLYNFNSTFSGTHFIAPREYQVQAGVTF
jgi:Carboxypeptidase regulatory-like domain